MSWVERFQKINQGGGCPLATKEYIYLLQLSQVVTHSFYLISSHCFLFFLLRDKHFEIDEKNYCRIDESIIPFYKVELYQLDKSMNPFPTVFILFHMEHQSISFFEQPFFSFSSDFLTYRLNFCLFLTNVKILTKKVLEVRPEN